MRCGGGYLPTVTVAERRLSPQVPAARRPRPSLNGPTFAAQPAAAVAAADGEDGAEATSPAGRRAPLHGRCV